MTPPATAGKVVPNDYTGRVSDLYTGPFEADPQIMHDIDKQFWEAFKAAYPNIQTDVQSITYNELLDKFRTALLGNAAPMVVRLQILGGADAARPAGHLSAADGRRRQCRAERAAPRTAYTVQGTIRRLEQLVGSKTGAVISLEIARHPKRPTTG